MNSLVWMRSFSWWKWVFMQIRKLIVSWFKKGDQIWFMRGSRNFRQVGEGGPGPSGIYIKLWQRFFYLLFLVLNLFYRSQAVTFKENYYLPRFQRGWNIFQGGVGGRVQLFTGGGGGGSNCFFPIETHITCDFPGGPDRLLPPPRDPPMWFRASWYNLSTRFSLFFFNVTFANSFVERGGNVASAAVLPVAVVIKY